MLLYAERVFASQPSLKRSYASAEAFGRHCLQCLRNRTGKNCS
jgi:hypothetical protein